MNTLTHPFVSHTLTVCMFAHTPTQVCLFVPSASDERIKESGYRGDAETQTRPFYCCRASGHVSRNRSSHMPRPPPSTVRSIPPRVPGVPFKCSVNVRLWYSASIMLCFLQQHPNPLASSRWENFSVSEKPCVCLCVPEKESIDRFWGGKAEQHGNLAFHCSLHQTHTIAKRHTLTHQPSSTI